MGSVRLVASIWLLLGLGCFEVHGERVDASAPVDSGRSDPPPTARDAGETRPPPTPEALCATPPCVATRMSAGSNHTCIVLESGRVGCWGENSTGQLGDGTTSNRPFPVAVPGVSDALDVAAGRLQTCILHGDGRVRCTDRSGGWMDSPAGTASGVAAGTGYAAAITDRGIVSWGESATGWTWTDPLPGPIEGGELHLCGIHAGDVWCIGRNSAGSLGTGAEADATEPVRALLEGTAVEVSAGRGHTCAVIAGGATWCWGAGWDGQLGNGSTESTTVPIAVAGLPPSVHVAANGHHTCTAAGAEGVYCWGNNDSGQSGAAPSDPQHTPVPVPRVPSATRVAIGVSHSCAIDASGQVWCWGENRAGQLGRGTVDDDWEPGPVSMGAR